MTQCSRRKLVEVATIGAASAYLWPRQVYAADRPPHFFLQILIAGGVDPLYLFDARPKVVTDAGKMANYATSDPVVWTGTNGGSCLASNAASQSLQAFKSRISIVNGVHSSSGFEGHTQNSNAVLTANPFGGDYFGAKMSPANQALGFVQLGSPANISLSNLGGALVLKPDVLLTLAERAASISGSGEPRWQRKVISEADQLGLGKGMFSDGSRAYANGLRSTNGLATQLGKVQVTLDAADSEMIGGVKAAFGLFAQGVTSSALVYLPIDVAYDTHAETEAVRSEAILAPLIADLRRVFDLLMNTPFDAAAGLSMLDVTTVLISSEFGRTHGQDGKSPSKTGTDHNPQCNMMIFAGRGIKGGQVIGASDLDVLGTDGGLIISPAHRQLDPHLFKRMGRPFNFDSSQPVMELPTEYAFNHYVTSASVINTVLTVFGVANTEQLKNESGSRAAGASPARPIAALLA